MLDMGHYLQDAASGAQYWNPIIRIASPYDEFRARHNRTTPEAAIAWLTYGEGNPNSIVNCIARARDNAGAMRDAISSEMWEQVNTTYLQLRNTDVAQIRAEGEHTFFRRVREASQLFQGLVETTAPRDESYQWMQLGKYLERADATTRLIDVKYFILLPSVSEVGGPIDHVQWIAVLKSCSAYEAYQHCYVNKITPARIAEFLVLNRNFPRSARFCFDHIYWSLRSISNEHGALTEQPAEIVASHVRHMLADTSMSGIIQHGMHQYMLQLQDYCIEISQKITGSYFQGALQHMPSERK
jgi:uncharacterized alpha-E superfamily protein